VPGCPELAAWIASIESVRIVLIAIVSMDGRAGDFSSGAFSKSLLELIYNPFALFAALPF
jgi:hypothetical protein